MIESVRNLLKLAWSHRGKFGLLLASVLASLILIFPFGDLSDLVSSQISKMTQNQVYVQFEEMKLGLLSGLGLSFEEIQVEAVGFPPLQAREVKISPSLRTLITQKPAGSISAKDFLHGDVDLSLQPGKKSDNGVERQQLIVNAQRLNLAQMGDLLQLPVALRGQLDLSGSALADLTLQEQPEVEVLLKVDRFELPSANIQTMMGPLNLPELKLASLELKGRLAAGKFIIENGAIGKDSDEVFGSIKGDLDVKFRNSGGGVSPQMGGYNLEVDLKIKKTFQDRAGIFLIAVDNYKTPIPEGSHYHFRLNALNTLSPPNITAPR